MVKIDTSEVKRGTVLDVEGKLYKVVDTSHTHTGRGSATYGFKVKDIVNGGTNTLSYKASTTLEKAEVMTVSAIFLYEAGGTYSFMENDTSEMFDLDSSDIDDVIPYLKENLDVYLMKHEGNILGVILPATITYTIADTVPGIKGNRAQAGKKPATLDNGLEVQVPLHKEVGQEVTVNTTTGTAS